MLRYGMKYVHLKQRVGLTLCLLSGFLLFGASAQQTIEGAFCWVMLRNKALAQ